MTDIEIRDNQDAQRFEAEVDGQLAMVRYTVDDDRIRLTHSNVPQSLEGRGIGSKLARHALESARERGLQVWPECQFIASYIKRHPDYLELVDPDFPRRNELQAEDR